MKIFLSIFRLMRLSSHVKNFVIILPALFGGKLLEQYSFKILGIGFILFSLLASLVYILNDIIDSPEDQNHPIKKYRPIASGEISVKFALVLAVALLGIIGGLSFFTQKPESLYLLGLYLVVNIAYTFYLKKIPIVEFFMISVFFEIRLFFGANLLNISLSHWLVLTIFFLATIIAVGKRRDDVLILEELNSKTRSSVEYYNKVYLDTLLTIFTSSLVLIYILYTLNDTVIQNFGANFYFTNIFVILGLSRYLYFLFVKRSAGDPIAILYKDRFIQVCVLGWLTLVINFIYG